MNEKKMSTISIILIIGITLVFLFINNSFNFEFNNLVGRSIDFGSSYIDETNIEPPIRNFVVSEYKETKNCDSICPLGFDVLNSTCKSINLSCQGKVVCGLYVNETLMNI
ncbi:MAG: hypothetical protein ACMXX8_03670, partial [Candidatus Woesearchaeota archaeon]